jgi:hypothetical protein
MSVSASSSNNNNNNNNNTQPPSIEVLKAEAVALEGGRLFDEAHEKLESLLLLQQSALGTSHDDTMETMSSIMRVIDLINNSGETSDNIE